MLPVDCDPGDLSATVLLEAEFSSLLANIKARRVVVFVDACHSGGAGSFKAVGNIANFGFNEKSLDRLAHGTGRVLIASSRASETSLVLAGASNSLFTEHLVGGLRGAARTHGDGLIRIFEIFNYVAEKVRGAAPGRQHPIFKASSLEDNFAIALDQGGAKGTAVGQKSTVSSSIRRELEEILSDLYPTGPLDQEIWARSGGDVSRLRLTGTGRANWFAAIRLLQQGGGGANISQSTLVQEALQDFPHHHALTQILQQS